MIEKSDPFATSESEPLIRGRRNPFVFPNSCEGNAPVARSQCRQSIQQIGRAGAVVDQKELPVLIRLRQDGFESFFKPRHRRVKNRRDNANERLGSKSTRFL